MAVRIAIVILLYIPSLFGQQYNFKKYDVKDGVALSQIGALSTYSNGKLLVATIGGGLNIYDGQNFELFNTTNGLVNNNIYSFLKESDLRLWLGTEKGLSLFNGTNFRNFHKKDGLPSETILSLAKSKDSIVWIGTDAGLAKYKDGIFEIIEDSLIKAKGIWSLYVDSKDNLWAGIFDKTVKYKIENGKLTKGKIFSGIPNINCFLEDSEEIMWAGSDEGLLKIEDHSITTISRKDGLSGNTVNFLFKDSREKLWVGTEEGVSLITESEIIKVGVKEGLTDYKIWSITEDLENNIWIGSDEGLYKMSDMSFKIYKTFNGKPIGVWSIIERAKNEYWLLSESQGIVEFKNGKFSQVEFPSLRQRGISAVFFDKDENLWLALEREIYKYAKNNYNKAVDNYSGLFGTVNSIIQKENGNILFGTYYHGTIEYNGKTFESLDSSELQHLTIYDYLVDSQKRLWAATANGLRIIGSDSSYTPKGFEKLNNYSFLNLVKDKYNNIWAGSYEAGLFTFSKKDIENGSFDNVSINNGLNNASIMATTCDANGDLWISTNAGLNMLDIEEYHKTGKKKILAFGLHDGIPGVEGYQNGMLTDSENNIVFSSIDGLVFFDPNKIQKNYKPPTVEIKSVKVLDKEFNETIFSKTDIEKLDGNIIELPYDNNNLSVEFVGISLTSPSNVKYSYQLNEEEWSKPSTKSIVYLPNLTHGNYSLKIKACNNNNIWSKYFAVLNVEITAPFWRLFWVQLLTFFVIIGLIVLFYLFRLNRMNKINMDLEERIAERIQYEAQLKNSESELRTAKEVAENSDKLKTEFLAQMSHEIRTPINSILSYTSLLKEDFKNKMDEDSKDGFSVIENSSHRLIRTIDSILNMSQLQTKSLELNKKEQNISGIIKNLFGEFKGIASSKKIKLEINLFSDECFVRVDQYTFTQMLANLIDNAIKYTNKGKVVVSLSKHSEEKFLLEVTDTGIGMSEQFKKNLFQPFTQEEQGYSRKYDGAGLGLSLVKKYADINKLKLTFTSTKNVGTTFTIELNN